MADTIPYLIDENDPDLESGMVEYGSCTGYLSRPKGGASLGSVVVIHENVGLVDHIKDVARHFAKEGFAALAPDMLQRTGGTAQYQTSEDAIAAIRSLDPNGCVEDLTSALEYLKSQGFANGKVGVVGYCWGGGQSLNFATKCNQLNAAVVYYGRNPDPLEQVANISCPLMGNYAEDDPNIMPGIEPLKEELAKSGKTIDLKIYGGGAKHAFNNNTNADRWHPEAAKDAWQRTVDFYKANLSG
jgi:carboxymethylenebutenolidase